MDGITTSTTVQLANGSVSLRPTIGSDKAMLNIDYGGERGEPTQKAFAYVDLDELMLAITTYKELNNYA